MFLGRGGARARVAGLLAAAAFVATGCSSDGRAPASVGATGSVGASTARPVASPTPSPKLTSAFHSTGDPVNDAYIQFWLGFVNAQASRDPNYAP